MSIFFVVSPLICSSFLSSGIVLRGWKRIKVGFLRQGSSKLASPISYVFALGSLQRGRGDFFRDQDLIQNASPDVPRRRKTCIFTHKTRSQTMRTRVFTYKTRSQSVPDASEHIFLHIQRVPAEILENRFLECFGNDFWACAWK